MKSGWRGRWVVGLAMASVMAAVAWWSWGATTNAPGVGTNVPGMNITTNLPGVGGVGGTGWAVSGYAHPLLDTNGVIVWPVYFWQSNAAPAGGVVPSSGGNATNLTVKGGTFNGTIGSSATNASGAAPVFWNSTLSNAVQGWTTNMLPHVNVLAFGADSTGVADCSAALSNALNFCSYSNGAPARLYFPAGTYKYSLPLNWPTNTGLVEVFGDGKSSTDEAESAPTILRFTGTATNAIQFVASASNYRVFTPWIHDLAIIGPTNTTGCGIWMGNAYTGTDYGSIQFGRFERLTIAGFSKGLVLWDSVACKVSQCNFLANTNAAIWAHRPDTLLIENCSLGYSWGGASDRQTALYFEGQGWAQVASCEIGNCWRGIGVDQSVVTAIGCNFESFYGDRVFDIANLSYVTLVNPRYSITSGNLAHLVYMTNYSAIPASTVMIENPKWDASTNMVCVAGNYTDLPRVLCQESYGAFNAIVWTNVATGGGWHTNNGSTVPSLLAAQSWTEKQIFKGSPSDVFEGYAPVRIQSGSLQGTLEIGASMYATTNATSTTKFGTINGQTYAAATYDLCGLELLGWSGENILCLGAAHTSAKNGYNTIRFYTSPTTTSQGVLKWSIDLNGELKSEAGYKLAAAGGYYHPTNAVSSWPTAPRTHGESFVGNSNGVVYILTSVPGSLTWAATNKLAP